MYSTAHRVLVFLIIYLYSNHDLPPLRPPWGEAPRGTGGLEAGTLTTGPPLLPNLLLSYLHDELQLPVVLALAAGLQQVLADTPVGKVFLNVTNIII